MRVQSCLMASALIVYEFCSHLVKLQTSWATLATNNPGAVNPAPLHGGMMQYEITDLAPASRPAGAREDWWQMRGVMDEFNAADDDEAVAWLNNGRDNEEADLSTYGRIGWQLVATRHSYRGGTALWEKLY